MQQHKTKKEATFIWEHVFVCLFVCFGGIFFWKKDFSNSIGQKKKLTKKKHPNWNNKRKRTKSKISLESVVELLKKLFGLLFQNPPICQKESMDKLLHLKALLNMPRKYSRSAI